MCRGPPSRHGHGTAVVALAALGLCAAAGTHRDASRAERGLYDVTFREPSASPQVRAGFSVSVPPPNDALLPPATYAWDHNAHALALDCARLVPPLRPAPRPG